MFSPSSENLEIRNTIVERLLDVPHGGRISNERLHELSRGRRHLIQQAFRAAERTHGALFANIRGEGYQRMKAGELPRIGMEARKSIANKAKAGMRKMVNGKKFANDVDRQTKLKINQEMAVLGLLRETAKDGY